MRAVVLLLALAACRHEAPPPQAARLIESHGCATCHHIPGIPGATGRTGPPLGHMGARVYVAGVAPATERTLARFLRDPKELDPRSAMPRTGLSQTEASLLAAWLRSLE
ncbi:c-type cytochrome [Frigidibacter sp. MR17.24]|uniref:c-type cytochrome n=1 Tax=Frigidibacter sp. MR17.24 TaxID=3127345 RepID=UPI003012F986